MDYSVSSKNNTITDPILAYIIGQRTDMSNLIKTYPDAAQQALWAYLANSESEYKSDDKDKILKDITCASITLAEGSMAKTIFENAITYKNNLEVTPNLTLNINGSNLDVNVSGNFTSFELYINGTQYTADDDKNGKFSNVDENGKFNENGTTIKIPLSYINSSSAEVEVKAYGTKYSGEYCILTNAYQQRLMVVTSFSESDEVKGSKSDTIILNTNISLQKYITKVTSADNSVTYRNETERKNKYATTNLDSGTSLKHNGCKVSTNNSSGGANNYKSANPIQIEAGDTVEYTITVYNNSSVPANVKICDRITVDGSAEITGITSENNTITYSQTDEGTLNDYKYYNIYVDNNEYFKLGAGDERTFKVYVKYNSYTNNILNNKVWISGTNPDNDPKYRTVDADYVKMKEYAVSLEKYVSKVTDTNRTEKTINADIKDRAGKAVYLTKNTDGTYVDNTQQYSEFKINNQTKYDDPVTVSNGDYVTYTITLKNDGDTQVKITRIGDILPEGVKLISVSNSSNTMKNMDEVSGKNIDDYIDEKNLPEQPLYKLNEIDNTIYIFTDCTLLSPGETESYYVTVKVTEPNISTNVLRNNAGIWWLRNKNNECVEDTTMRNNSDNDYIQLQDITISGTVWNDVAWDKAQKEYNGIYDNEEGKDKLLDSSIKVYLYRYKKGTLTRYKYDMYRDNVLDINDINVLQNYLLGGNLPSGVNGDINGDKTINALDLMDLRNIINSDTIKKYDINGDNITDENDINVLKNYLLGGNLPNGVNADINGDGIIDAIDLLVLTNFINSNKNKYVKETVSVEVAEDTTLVATTTTDGNGQYLFSQDNLNYVSDKSKKYIKGPQDTDTNRWAGTYYSYYVVFEYDGVTYTSTAIKDNENCLGIYNSEYNDSNARERLDSNTFDGYVNQNRTDFNNSFNTINNESGIEYTTKNESGYIPQSIHEYNPSTMSIQSSTKLISLSNNEALEQQLKHVNLGLRGRDTFDLKLATDVYSTQVTVNEVPGVYQYNNNKVTLRRGDLSNNYNYVEDAANIYSESGEYEYIENEDENKNKNSYDQDVRKTDIKNEKYGSTGLEIQVTYKITVQNVSSTDGTATKITDYYDDKYTFIRAYDDNNQSLSTTPSTTGTGYKSVVINTPSTNLTTTDGGTSTMNIYIVYKLKDAANTLLNSIPVDGKISLPTFNIAEITEYKTQCAKGQSEATRGLLDINSAPGSIDKEQARLTTTEEPNMTTLKYYFEKARAYLNDRTSRELNKLKYEDDTSAAPILYFTSSDSERTITGTVFEDKTTTNPTTRIKTGNGKLDEGEVGVYGATVELVELKTDKAPQDIAENEGTVRYTKQTDKDGKFTISGFLPGYYVIRYRYGDTTDTVLLHQGGEGINKQSYNGEDYQSTNNAFEVKDTNGNVVSNILDRSKNLWYVMNKDKGISTATDNSSERTTVSDKVTGFTDEKMTVLNNMRDMIGTYDKNDDTLTANRKYNINKTEIVEIPETKVTGINEVKEQTKMFATTPQMLFTVEQTINLNELGDKKQALINSKEIIVNSTYSDLGEWAMFPDANNEHYKSYLIENMNFGIAEVPVTTIDLQKTVQAFNLTDSTGKNTIASVVKNNSGKWELKGDVIAPNGATSIDVSAEDEKLQGARLQVTYAITSKINVEKNYDGKEDVMATITELVDYIDNNLSYNSALGENSKYWELTTYNDIFTDDRKGTVDPEGKKYTTIVKAKEDSPILKNTENGVATITLEKILSSTDSTIEEIITSTVDTYEYNNTIEITGISYENITSDTNSKPRKDLVRTPDRFIVIAKLNHDSETAETITIHPPTGDSSISIMYYVIAVISLVVLAAGVFGIKKFVLKK